MATFCIIKFTFKADGFWSNTTFHGGSIPLEKEESLYITLHYLTNQAYIRLIGEKFGRTESTVHKIVANNIVLKYNIK